MDTELTVARSLKSCGTCIHGYYTGYNAGNEENETTEWSVGGENIAQFCKGISQ